jgi:hypothetical protein
VSAQTDEAAEESEAKTTLISAACSPSYRSKVKEAAAKVGRSESNFVWWVVGKHIGIFSEEQ